ncbi:membrane metallo-endopeptidase-like 1 [Dermacentor andersoni]|uniref:membrane metallo-endopeptidase-like 1 n=1 Tax=Dermacentor andersoni TaxID=34620 RepID=UPI003B3B6C7E
MPPTLLPSDRMLLVSRGTRRLGEILNKRCYWVGVSALTAVVFVLLGVTALPQLEAFFAPGHLSVNVTDDLQYEAQRTNGSLSIGEEMASLAAKSRRQPQPYVCSTAACAKEGKRVVKAVDNSTNPCDDFYRYACTNWMAFNKPGPKDARASVDDRLLYSYAEIMSRVLAQKHNVVPSVKVLFDNCVNPTDELFGHIRSVYFYLLGFQDWPYLATSSGRISADELSSKMGDLHRHLGIDSLFHFSLVEEYENNGTLSPVIGEPNLLIGRLQGPLNEYRFLSDAFQALMHSMGKVADTDVAQIELDLAQRKTSHTHDCMLFPKHCGAMSLSNLPGTRLFTWRILLERAFGDRILALAGHKVKVTSLEYLSSFANQGTLPRKADVLNYIVFRVSMALSPFIKNVELRNKLASIAYADQPEFAKHLPATHYCVKLLDRMEPYVPMILAYSGSVKLLGYETLRDLLLKRLNTSFYEFARNDSRFFGAFKDSLLRKLRALSWEPLVPRSFFDKAFRNKYFSNMYSSNPTAPLNAFFYYWLKNAMMRRNWLSSDWYRQYKTGWKGGFLRTYPSLEAPYRNLEIPLAVFDFVMSSHASIQLLHVPRVATRVYRSLYRFIYYWAYTFYFHTAATDPVSVLENIRGCLQQDYAALRSPFSNASLNSERTSLSDLFDALAIPAAFNAFLAEALRGSSAFRLAEALSYTHEQLFFLYYAFGHCENNNPDFLAKWMRQGSESPAWYRVNGPLRHFPAFSKAFKCPAGSFMNPVKRCVNS